MTFDPFGDFATEGYLRNFEKEKDLAIIKRAENTSFTTGLDETFAMLAKSKVLTYDEVLRTHGILFGAVYSLGGARSYLDGAEPDHKEGIGHLRERTGNPGRG